MPRSNWVVWMLSGLALALLGALPCRAAAQIPRAAPLPRSLVVAGPWSTPPSAAPYRIPWMGSPPPTRHSAARIIVASTVVGAGAGLVIGLLWRGASIGKERAAVVPTWTALGAGAGLVSGVITWSIVRGD